MFPPDFYWGASTSAYQVEGSIEDNNWGNWVEENSVQKVIEYEDKRPDYISDENYEDACNPENYITGSACNSYNEYKKDVELLKKLGLNSYRFSIEWSRIEPEKGEFSEEGIQYYKNLVRELRKNNIEPFVTCWHWPVPTWLEEEGGLVSKDIPEYFARYVEFLVENLGEDVNYWMTINEPIVVSFASYMLGDWPPQKRNPILFYKSLNNLVDMHKMGYSVIKEYDEDLQVSVAKQNAYVESYNNNPVNKLIANIGRYLWNFWYLDKIKDDLDYIGLNYYFHRKVGIFGLRDEKEPLNDMGWWMDPSGISYPIKELWDRYNLPIYITENGLADREDKDRKWWLDKTMEALKESLNEGVDLRGYLHWSLLDNFEWAEGFWPRFGLATRDREIKESGYYYRDIIKNH
jgi:beta-glucosidase